MNVLTENAVSRYLLQRSLAGFPKFEKKKERKKNQKTAKTYTNISDGTPTTSVQSNIWIFFRLCQTNEMKIPYNTDCFFNRHFFFDTLRLTFILSPEIVLSFTLSLTGEMRVTLLQAERSLSSIKIKTPDISTNVDE